MIYEEAIKRIHKGLGLTPELVVEIEKELANARFPDNPHQEMRERANRLAESAMTHLHLMHEQAEQEVIQAEDKWIARPTDREAWLEYDKAHVWWSYLDDQIIEYGFALQRQGQ